MADNPIIQTIKDFVGLLTPVALGLLTFFGIKMSRKQDKMAKDVNGKMEQLLKSKEAVGVEKGRELQKDESATVASQVVEAIKEDPDVKVTKT